MGSDDASSIMEPQHDCNVKVHRLLCLELKKFVDRISQSISAIESARPSTTGMQALCLLHVTIDKAKLLIHHCSDSSKLYLALKADKILLRCQRICGNMELRLSQVQEEVPSLLSGQISEIISDLRTSRFILDPSEDEAGKVVLALLLKDIPASSSMNSLELQPLQFAASKLNLASRLAILIERRSIKKFLNNARNMNHKSLKILNYFLYLVIKYGSIIGDHQIESTNSHFYRQFIELQATEDYTNILRENNDGSPEPPQEFKCPISKRLMYDPVIIASGRTFEKKWIQKWIAEGNETCPATGLKLENLSLTPNPAMKGLISKWCLMHGVTVPDHSVPSVLSTLYNSSSTSIASFDSYMNNLNLQTSNISLRSSDTTFDTDLLSDKNASGCQLELLQINSDTLRSEFSWEAQCKAVDDILKQLDENEEAWDLTVSTHYVKLLIKFLKNALQLGDVKAQRDGANALLTILSKRSEKVSFLEDELFVLASLLDSEIVKEALSIMETLSCQQSYKSKIVSCGILPSIFKVLDTKNVDYCTLAMKILCNLSSNSETGCHIVYLDCINKLVKYLGDPILGRYCINIIKNLCSFREGRIEVAETHKCIKIIVGLLQNGTPEEQEHAADVVHALCYEQVEYIEVVVTENVIHSLVNLSIYGSCRGKVIASELLQLIGHVTDSNPSGYCLPKAGLNHNSSNNLVNSSKKKKASLKRFGFLGRRIYRFSQPSC